MIKYKITANKFSQHILDVTLTFIASESITKLQMPYWRPGRYEGGNFSKNIIGLHAYTEGEPLEYKKTTGNSWELNTLSTKGSPNGAGKEVEVRFECYAAELTAGNTYLDEELMLINPVNCLVYVLGREAEPMQLSLQIPAKWKVATAMKPIENGRDKTYHCADLQELLDTPILASENIETLVYTQEGINFYIDIYGEGIIDKIKFQKEFEDFTRVQIAAFGDFPVDRYHFLTLLLPHKAYHGVEHESSTVVIMGPSAEVNRWDLYKELIGVSSHELYHTWNVKSLRPADWTPYDFSGPGFSRLGYVAEGVTTYMGDWILWQSRFFSDEAFLLELSTQVQRHLDNEGRFHLSLADSSIDTWVDGYGRGTPRRRVSIYVEGALLALVCDIQLLNATKGKMSLTDVMKSLYEKYGAKKGFTEDQYWAELQSYADLDWSLLRKDVVDGTGKLEKYVEDALSEMDLSISAKASEKAWENNWGVSFAQINGNWEVLNVLKDSPAEQAGIWFGDQVLEIGGMHPDVFFAKAEYAVIEGMEITLRSGFRQKTITPKSDGKVWMKKYRIVQDHDSDQVLFKKWKNYMEKRMKPAEI